MISNHHISAATIAKWFDQILGPGQLTEEQISDIYPNGVETTGEPQTFFVGAVCYEFMAVLFENWQPADPFDNIVFVSAKRKQWHQLTQQWSLHNKTVVRMFKPNTNIWVDAPAPAAMTVTQQFKHTEWWTHEDGCWRHTIHDRATNETVNVDVAKVTSEIPAVA